MRSRFGEEPLQTQTPEFKAHTEYELPFAWGSLHVTEQAHKAYGLAPLTTASLENESGVSMPNLPDFRTHIWLVAPDELPFTIEAFPGLPLTMGAAMTEVTPSGIEVICGFDKTATEIADGFTRAMEADDVEPPEDQRPDELEQQTHQLLAHNFARLAGRNVAPYAHQLLEAAADKVVLTKAKNDFFIGLGGAAFINAYELAFTGRVDVASELTGTGMVAVGSAIAYRGIKKYFKGREAVKVFVANTSVQYAQMVAEDIHRTYCARYFDHQLQGMLGDQDDPNQ